MPARSDVTTAPCRSPSRGPRSRTAHARPGIQPPSDPGPVGRGQLPHDKEAALPPRRGHPAGATSSVAPALRAFLGSLRGSPTSRAQGPGAHAPPLATVPGRRECDRILRVRFDQKARENLEAAERLLPDDESGESDAFLNAAASRAY